MYIQAQTTTGTTTNADWTLLELPDNASYK